MIGVIAGACTPTQKPAAVRWEAAAFDDLPGWAEDDHAAALGALLRSCPALTRSGAGEFGSAAVWQSLCAAAEAVPAGDARAARGYFERNFVPWRVRDQDGGGEGLFTGYYEAELDGARQPTARFHVPLYARPPDLVSVDLGRFREDLRGERIAGRVRSGRLIPYPDRAGIERGALAGKGLELAWVDDPADAFFLHIQGSGRIRLRDGSIMRVGYDGSNGHLYTAIGRELIARGAIAREEMSMQAIRRWLAANPGEADRLMHSNRSFIFFRVLDGPGPLGALGVPLTAGRSLAVDRVLLPLGLPVWLETETPDAALPDGAPRPLRRLMVAQDTGGAIRGAVRGDVFWGAGADAEHRAGRMNAAGRYWFLVPRGGAGGV